MYFGHHCIARFQLVIWVHVIAQYVITKLSNLFTKNNVDVAICRVFLHVAYCLFGLRVAKDWPCASMHCCLR